MRVSIFSSAAAVLVCFCLVILQVTLLSITALPTPHTHATSLHHPIRVDVASVIESILNSNATQDANAIINAFTNNGTWSGVTWQRLANFTDTIGPRVCGSDTLESAVDFMIARLQEDGLDNVHAEQTSIPYWKRGEESATLLQPRQAKLNMLGLGGSIGTQQYGSGGITAEVLVVKSFDELTLYASEAQGKIVVFNQQCDWVAQPIDCYGTSVIYRGIGAQKVAAVGGLASLIKSVAAFSINSPHTGMIEGYVNASMAIPTAALTIEDVEMLQRMQDRGQNITINLQMEAEMMTESAVGHNVVAEITGSEYPEEVVILSGHLDSWDVGTGSMDDGGGMAISWHALTVLRSLGLRPKRTLRFIAWSCEEFGGIGAGQYFKQHQDEVANMSLVMESDLGVFHPYGLQFTGNADAMAIMQTIGVELLTSINASAVTTGGEGTDISPWMIAGVPGASLANDNERYFWYHHSNGDTMTVLDSNDVDLCAAVWTVHAYTVANLDTMLPRGNC